jgi:nucleotide-binding universal stress UspA family protein
MESFMTETSAIWPVDPHETNLRPPQETMDEVKRFLGGGFLQVHPVYICSGDQTSLENAEQEVREYLQPMDLGPIAPVEVIYSSSNKRADWAEKIIVSARERNAELILLTSHGRSAIGALILGSFAKELLQKSPLPVLFINPKKMAPHWTQKALFPTDFSPASWQAFEKFLNFVRGRVEELILLHVVSFPLMTYTSGQVAGVMTPLPNSYFEEQKAWADREVQRWLADAQHSGVNIRFQALVEESVSMPSSAIEKIAEREKIGWIGLASHSGPLDQLVVGSVARDLLAAQKFNLWICGPAAVREKI